MLTIVGKTTNNVFSNVSNQLASIGAHAITYVQSTSGSANGGSPESVSFASAVTPGDLVVAACYSNLGGPLLSAGSVTDNQGNAYSLATPVVGTASSTSFAIYYADNVAASGTFTITCAGNANLNIHEYRGAVKTSPIDGTGASAGGTGSAVNPGSVTTTVSNDLLFSACGDDNIHTMTGTSGYTVRQTNYISWYMASEDKLGASVGSQSATWTLSGSDSWYAGLVAFKAA